jgi:hypothetical protein
VHTIGSRPTTLVLVAAAALSLACGDRSVLSESAEFAHAAGSGATNKLVARVAASACIDGADISDAIGVELDQALLQGTEADVHRVCTYASADESLAALVTVTVGSSESSDHVFQAMREGAEGVLGAGRAPEAIAIGERGYAYGSTLRSEAVTVVGDRVFHARITSGADADIGDRKAGMIEILKLLMLRAAVRS